VDEYIVCKEIDLYTQLLILSFLFVWFFVCFYLEGVCMYVCVCVEGGGGQAMLDLCPTSKQYLAVRQ
jgi:hypothetical protein